MEEEMKKLLTDMGFKQFVKISGGGEISSGFVRSSEVIRITHTLYVNELLKQTY